MCDKGFYMFKNKCSLWCCLVIGFIVLAGVAVAEGSEKKDLLFVQDNIGDDKGPGYYQYPLDKRLKRGTFDIKSFKVTDDGDIVTFEIQMRNYIMREWPDSKKTGYQDFVANLWDIYIDIDGIPNSGYKYALPAETSILPITWAENDGFPISEIELEEILNDKIDELEFQEQIPDILSRICENYSRQGDHTNFKRNCRAFERSGFRFCRKRRFPNRLINRDVALPL